LHQIIELVKNRETREPLSPFNKGMSEPMQKVSASFVEDGLSTFVKWNWIFCTPPLIINDAELQEGLDKVDRALTLADAYVD
jgi:taurine--2-oxoglutarate transaminase